MNILLVSDFYPPMVGGLEKHVFTLANKIKNKNHNVSVVTINSNTNKDKFSNENGVQVYRLIGLFQKIPFLFNDPKKRFHPPFKDPIIVKKIKKIINIIKPDVIHAHGWILFSLIEICKKRKIKLVVTLHDYGFICPKKNLMLYNKKICDKQLKIKCLDCALNQYGLLKSILIYLSLKLHQKKLKKIDQYISVSPFVKKVHLNNNNLNIITIPNFYDDSEIKKIGEDKEFTLPKKFILFVGAASPLKGINLLINKFKKIKHKKKYKLIIFTTLNPQYKIKSSKDVIVYIGESRQHTLQAFKKCKAVVIPSLWPDPCPTTAFEAMAFGKPIIANPVGGIPFILKKYGFIKLSNFNKIKNYEKIKENKCNINKIIDTIIKYYK